MSLASRTLACGARGTSMRLVWSPRAAGPVGLRRQTSVQQPRGGCPLGALGVAPHVESLGFVPEVQDWKPLRCTTASDKQRSLRARRARLDSCLLVLLTVEGFHCALRALGFEYLVLGTLMSVVIVICRPAPLPHSMGMKHGRAWLLVRGYGWMLRKLRSSSRAHKRR